MDQQIITTDKLSKKYPGSSFYAVKNLSLSIPQGEIYGFLGPNGAGKSTMMKILTCYLPPSGGKASVCGFDIHQNSLEVRKQIGYLPERNPLYHDMYVKEFLGFVAGIYRMKNVPKKVAEMIELTGLEKEQNKMVKVNNISHWPLSIFHKQAAMEELEGRRQRLKPQGPR